MKSGWVSNYGIIPYIFYGLYVSLLKAPNLLSYNLHPVVIVLLVIALGFFTALITRALYVNMVYYTGKIWKGQATKNEIDTVVSLSFIPYLIVLLHTITMLLFSLGDFSSIYENNILLLVVYLFSLRTILLGIAKVQKFSYGLSVLSIWLLPMIIVMIYFLLRGLF